MYGLQVVERARSVTSRGQQGSTWAIPLACGLVLTATIASAIEERVVRSLSTEAAARTTIVDRADVAADALLTPRYFVAKLIYAGPDGSQFSLDCLTTRPGLDEGNGLVFRDPEEMAQAWSESCESRSKPAMAVSPPLPQP